MVPEDLQRAEQAHRSGDLVEAERLYRGFLAADSSSASAMYGLANLLIQRNDLEQADALLESAAAIEPDAADIALRRAKCLQLKGNIEQATSEARRSARLVTGDENFSVDVASLLLALGDARTAVTLLRAAPITQKKTAVLLARALGQTGDWDIAVSYLRQLCARNPGDAELAQELSIAAARLRDYTLAISAYQDYLAAITPMALDHVRFADLCLLARDVPRMVEQLALAEKAGADDADYYLLRARLERLRGDDVAARTACSQSLQRNPRQGQAWGIAVELAAPGELPALRGSIAEQLASNPASGMKLSDYDRQLMAYAQADAANRCDDFSAAAQALRAANDLQLESLRESGQHYQRQQEEDRFARQKQRFPALPRETAAGADDSARMVFIVGMPRSGTTLIERVLSRLPGVVAGGENEALGFVASQYERDLAAGELPPPAELDASQWQALAERYRSLTAVSGAVVTDKMPHNYLHVGLMLGMFPDARVIQMRRDPRDTVLSIYMRPFPPDHTYACDPSSLAHAWQLAHAYMDYWAALDPVRVMDVSFEEFVMDPVEGSQRLADFCQLPWDEGCLQPRSEQGPSFTFSERQVRRAIDSSHIGGWRRYQEFLPDLFDPLPQA